MFTNAACLDLWPRLSTARIKRLAKMRFNAFSLRTQSCPRIRPNQPCTALFSQSVVKTQE